jgi:hypothetical protein
MVVEWPWFRLPTLKSIELGPTAELQPWEYPDEEVNTTSLTFHVNENTPTLRIQHISSLLTRFGSLDELCLQAMPLRSDEDWGSTNEFGPWVPTPSLDPTWYDDFDHFMRGVETLVPTIQVLKVWQHSRIGASVRPFTGFTNLRVLELMQNSLFMGSYHDSSSDPTVLLPESIEELCILKATCQIDSWLQQLIACIRQFPKLRLVCVRFFCESQGRGMERVMRKRGDLLDWSANGVKLIIEGPEPEVN